MAALAALILVPYVTPVSGDDGVALMPQPRTGSSSPAGSAGNPAAAPPSRGGPSVPGTVNPLPIHDHSPTCSGNGLWTPPGADGAEHGDAPPQWIMDAGYTVCFDGPFNTSPLENTAKHAA